MSRRDEGPQWPGVVKVPANIDLEDKVVAGLTARQCVQLAGLLVVLWLAWHVVGGAVPLPVFAAVAVPVAGAGTAVVLGRREGLALERWLRAALAFRRAPRRMLPAGAGMLPAGVGALPLPVRGIGPGGEVRLEGGTAVLSLAGCVNFDLRSDGEQQALLAGLGRWLNSLTGPVQILARTQRLDLAPMAARLRASAAGLPHPLLEQAALEHAGFLEELAAGRDLLCRRTVVVHREDGTDARAGQRAARRAYEAAGLLAAAEIPVTVLDGPGAATELALAADPQMPLHPCPVLPDEPVRGIGGER